MSGEQLDDEALEYHARHLLLDEIDERGVQRLASSTAVIIGLGGLGCPAAAQLAACGMGRLVLVDDDRIERSNLQRQHLYREEDCGSLKAKVAARRLEQMNRRCSTDAKIAQATPDNLAGLIDGASLVLDCSDNFATRHAVNAACCKARVDLVVGAAERFDGQVMAFPFSEKPSPCYACLFPADDRMPEATPCAVLGVFSPLTAMVGSLMAAEAVRLAAMDTGDGLSSRMLAYDMRLCRSRVIAISPASDCPTCSVK